MRKQVRVCVVLGALLAIAPLPVAFAQNADAVESIESMPITPRIKTAMAATRGLKGSNINVDTVLESRTVTLSGTVISAAQRTLAGVIARQNASGFQIQNRLSVYIEQTALQQRVPVQFKRPGDFLQMLARSRGHDETTAFRNLMTPFSNVTRLLWFVSARGLTIVNVYENDFQPLFLTRAHLRHDLKNTQSGAFNFFSRLGYSLFMPSKQGSGLIFKPIANGLVVEMPDGHRLTWEREKGLLQLRKLEFLGQR